MLLIQHGSLSNFQPFKISDGFIFGHFFCPKCIIVCKDCNNEEKLPPVDEIEPELGYKVVFRAAAFQISLAQWLVTQMTRCRTLINI